MNFYLSLVEQSSETEEPSRSSPEVSVISSKEGKHSPHRSMATTSSLSHSR